MIGQCDSQKKCSECLLARVSDRFVSAVSILYRACAIYCKGATTCRPARLYLCVLAQHSTLTLNPSPISNYQLVPYRNPAAPNCYPDVHKQASNPPFDLELYLNIRRCHEGVQKAHQEDLHTHPFAAQFNKCDAPHAVLDVFRKQAQAFEEFRKGDDRLITWLDLTVNILSKCSATIGEALSSVVCLERCTSFLVTAF